MKSLLWPTNGLSRRLLFSSICLTFPKPFNPVFLPLTTSPHGILLSPQEFLLIRLLVQELKICEDLVPTLDFFLPAIMETLPYQDQQNQDQEWILQAPLTPTKPLSDNPPFHPIRPTYQPFHTKVELGSSFDDI